MDTSYSRLKSNPDIRVYAGQLSPGEWRALQEGYTVGDLLMPCCMGSAVPKTSHLGLQFFAHAVGECTSEPETIWHQGGKEAVAAAAEALGYKAVIERPSGRRWTADVWIDVPGAPAVVEIQHSYQHARDYFRRQERYQFDGISCLWLLPTWRFAPLLESLARRSQQNGVDLRTRAGFCVPELPVARLSLDDGHHLSGPLLSSQLAPALGSFLAGRWKWESGCWLVDGIPVHPLRSGQ